ncbi:MAG: LamG domain-containing protein [Gammaproteobacteria bacterium]|nr:LamG domain-containing protein [Gammaproteobacteria bacterium]
MTMKPYNTLWHAARTVLCALWLLLAGSQAAWSAITLVGSSSGATGNSGAEELPLTHPGGLEADDILIAQIAVRGNQTIGAPAGWTLVNRSNNGTSVTQAVYWSRAGASNPADPWTFSASDRAAGAIVAYRDVDPVAPINAFSVNASSSTSVTASSVTPTVSGTQLVGLFALARGNSGFQAPAGMAMRQENGTQAANPGITIESDDEAHAGGTAATGSRTALAANSADGIAHLVALQPNLIANYRMDETTWTSASGQVLDSSGRSHHATAFNGAAIAGATPAIPGTPGTCNYGMFDGANDYVAVPTSFPNLTTDFTITAWMRTTNNAKGGQRIFIDDQSNSGGYGFSLGDGGAGRLRFYTRAVNPIILDTPNVIQNNTWYFVAAVADIVAKTKSLYVYNQAGTQLAYVTQTYTGTWGTDAGAASIGGENNASGESGSSFKFSGNLDEVSVFSGALSAAKLSLVRSQTRPCSGGIPPVAPSGFNAFETATAAGSVSGVIRTKIAASTFNLAVVALKTAGSAVETAFAGDVKLELVDASAGASCGAYGLIRNLGTLTFTAADLGRKTLAGIGEPNAWPNARIRMTYPATGVPTVTACSTDNFTIRPANFGGVTVSDADSATAGTTRTLSNTAAAGGNVHKAGRPFRIAATASNAAGVATSNYSGAPAASLTACVLPVAGCTPGSLATGSWSAGSGTVTTDGASYSEVGTFAMKLVDASFAAVDAADGSTAAEMTIESAAVNVGRFVPDHFELTTASTPEFKTFNDTTCTPRTFTYAGQPFGYLTLPEATITAKNAAGGITTNYAGALWKLAPAGVAQVYAAVTGTLVTGLLLTTPPNVIATSGGAGTLTASAIDVAFARPNPVPPLTPPAPFTADISLSMSILDDTEDAVSGNGIINTTTPALFPSIAFDSGNEIRFGRLVLSNAHGSELLNLPVPIETQYWNVSGFARNTADFCTQFNATDVSLSNWQRDLNAGDTSVSLSGRFDAGRGNLKLSKPGTGNTGSVDLALQLGAASQSWLQGRWTGGDYDQDPAARASFGLYRGSKSLIYLREMY